MKKKLVLVLPVLVLVVAGFAAKNVFLAGEPPPEPHIAGAVVPLEKEFLVNLEGGRYAKVAVAVVVEDAGGGHGDGALAQEGAVRAVITDELTGLAANRLVDRQSRAELRKRILKTLKKSTDEHVEDVLFTDVTVQ